MSMVSITEAARLVSRSRTTLYRYIEQGKLSMCTDAQGAKCIDISELLRVFGELSVQPAVTGEQSHGVPSEQQWTGQPVHIEQSSVTTEQIIEQENLALKREIALLKEVISEKDKRLLLLEYHAEKSQDKPKKKRWWHFS